MSSGNLSSEFGADELGDAAWERLAEILDTFCEAWKQGTEPPRLEALLPDDQPALRAVVLVELVKLDMEFRSDQVNTWLPLERYFESWPELLNNGQPPAELVYEEFQILRRRDGGDALDDYEHRFPGSLNTLTRLLGDAASHTAPFRPQSAVVFEAGDRIDDFDLLTRLGKGAFATVFLARQNSMQRLVALKISADQGREHQMLAQLDHPHIVRVYDHRVIEDPPARLMYMQHIAGGTLQEVLAEARQLAPSNQLAGRHLVAAIDKLLNLRGESIPVRSENRRWLESANWSEVVSRIGSEIAQALAYAHRHDVLHRDLKPANVLLDKDCHVKLVDFNISFCSKLDGAAPTAYFGGSIAYMSPEQLEACSPGSDRGPADLDGRADLYSLGVILFELASGRRPFHDAMKPGDWNGTMLGLISARSQGLSEQEIHALSSTSPILVRAIRRSLAPDPNDRFADAASEVRHLELASDRRAEEIFVPHDRGWAAFARRTVFWAAGLAVMGISAAAALFIFSYNLEKSVPPDGLELFQNRLVPWVNIVLFSLGAAIIFGLTRPIALALKRYRQGSEINPRTLHRSIAANLQLGHHVSLMSVAEWTWAGVLFPLLLTIAGHSLSAQNWFDFVVSHLLAGLIAAAYSFWMVTWSAMYVWLPELLSASLDNDESTDWSPALARLQKQCGFYHVLAISVPPLAVAWLVLYHNSSDKTPLAVVSLVSLLGVAVLVWVSRRIQDRLDVLSSIAERLAETDLE